MKTIEGILLNLADEITRCSGRPQELQCASAHVHMAVEHLQKALKPEPQAPPSREDYEISRRERSEAISQREAMRERGLELKAQLDKHHTVATRMVAPGSWCSICGAKIPFVGGSL